MWRFYPGIIYPNTISYFDCAGYQTDYSQLVLEGILPDLDPEDIKLLDPAGLPDDIFIDKRTFEQMTDKCCPPQVANLMFEGIEMI